LAADFCADAPIGATLTSIALISTSFVTRIILPSNVS
jgi:hypothetical protein